jgi:hypothetical protein
MTGALDREGCSARHLISVLDRTVAGENSIQEDSNATV